MRLALATIITERFDELRRFYAWLLEVDPEIYRDSYAEFELTGARLGIWKSDEAAEYGLEELGGSGASEGPSSRRFESESSGSGSSDRARSGPGRPGRPRSDLLIEFEVDRVEPVYRHVLEREDARLIADLATQPWGHRGFYFRDPEGRPVNVFERVSDAAQE